MGGRDTDTKNIVLIGMRRSGKSTVGAIVAARLGRALVDTDLLVEKGAGRPVRRILESAGEAAFRRMESEAVRLAAAARGSVVSTGGGAVLDPKSVARLRRTGTLVYLAVAVDELIARMRADAKPAERPGLTDLSAEDEIRRLFVERDPVYRAAADHVVDGAAEPALVADRIILRIIGSLG